MKLLRKTHRFLKRIYFGFPQGEGGISWRAKIVGSPKRITLEKGSHIHPYALLVCENDAQIEIGEGTSINTFSKIHSRNGKVKIGRFCSFHSFNAIYGGGNVHVGDYVRIASHVAIVTSGHNYDDPSRTIHEQGGESKDIHIGNDVWIGAGAIILGGVTVGEHSVIAAGAVVTKDVPKNSVVAGVPARVVKNI